MTEGVINIYKEKGFTSHDVVAKLRGILGMRKIGHMGTLDPDAEGVLPVCLGRATKICGMVTETEEEKVYRTVMLLGVETDTQDFGGQVVRRAPVEVSEGQIVEAVCGFEGEYGQIPPMYSARKVNGRKLYELARRGRTVERSPRPVVIRRIAIEAVELPRVFMTVECSRGTYIRTLCHDIGQELGCGGCMEELLRVRSGRFSLETALTLKEVEELRDEGTLASHVLTVEEFFGGCPGARTLEGSDKAARNGNLLPLSQVRFEMAGAAAAGAADHEGTETAGQRIRLYDSRGCFIGIYLYEKDRQALRPEKLFLATEAAG